MSDDTNPKDALGAAKTDLSLVPPASLIHEARAMENGAKKYGPYNWRTKKVKARVYVAAALRHLLVFLDGESNSSDTNPPVHHLAHAKACCGIVLDALETGNLIDDRPTKGVAGRLLASQAEPTVSEREIAKARRSRMEVAQNVYDSMREASVPPASVFFNLPAVSSDHDEMAAALDLPLCGKEGCHVPLHQRDPYPTRFTD